MQHDANLSPAIIAVSSGSLLLPKEEQLTTPEATSPYITPSPPPRDLFRNDVGDGSPVSGNIYTKNGSLFVVNPSATPRDSPAAVLQSNQVESNSFLEHGGNLKVRSTGPGETDPYEEKNKPGYRGSSGVFPSILATPSIGVPATQIRSSRRESTRNLPVLPIPASQQKKSLFNWSKQVPRTNIRSLAISKPVMVADQNSSSQPFARMQTIDLATAAINERERREVAAARLKLVANRPAPRPPALDSQDALRKSISVKRKEISQRPQVFMPAIQGSGASGNSLEVVNGSTTSASLSPGREEVRRRSPRSVKGFDRLVSEKDLPDNSLQRKQTLGLPSNPRSQIVTKAREAGMVSEQTVMFINDIVYDDPGMVEMIINGVPETLEASKDLKVLDKSPTGNYVTTLKPSASIIHRPRPVKREYDQDRALFPNEPSPHHKRSKSGSSITPRKSILRSHPGSPTQLPPLPAPPTSAANLKHLLPNDTKSMTFDEKIELLFPAPPGLTLMHHRRSSVPSLPRVPSVFMSDSPIAQSPIKDEHQSPRASRRTTVASYGSQGYRLQPDTPNGPNFNVHSSIDSPIYDSRKSAFTNITSADSSLQDDSTTYWGSIHSKAPAVDLSAARRDAKPKLIQHKDTIVQEAGVPSLPPVPQINYDDDGDEIMTVMLHPDEAQALSFQGNRQSFFLDAGQSLPGDAIQKPHNGTVWHRRIGDELPTFSERRKNTRFRKMPPPTPLLLNSKGRSATVVIRVPEPSPIESPEQAIKQIQAQLKRFEDSSRGSVGSILRHMPDNRVESNESEHNHVERFRLLENLEREMGQQETQWQQMQSSLDRDSISEICTPQLREMGSSPVSLRRSSRTPPQMVSRRARIRSSMTLRSRGPDSVSTSSTQSSDNSRSSIWQQRLAEAQMQYLENVPALLRKRSFNFFSITKAQIGSPTPPDSISGSSSELEPDSEPESNNELYLVNKHGELPSLWQHPMISPKAAVGRMWNPPYAVATPVVVPEPPARSIRPKQRLNGPLTISSCSLWSQPHPSMNKRPVVGLWGSRSVRPRSIVTRRIAQRPQRKSKRITFLPDISMFSPMLCRSIS